MASGEALGRPSVGRGAAKRKERMMDGNFTIGRFGGVEVRLHWSLIAVFALIVWSLADASSRRRTLACPTARISERQSSRRCCSWRRSCCTSSGTRG